MREFIALMSLSYRREVIERTVPAVDDMYEMGQNISRFFITSFESDPVRVTRCCGRYSGAIPLAFRYQQLPPNAAKTAFCLSFR